MQEMGRESWVGDMDSGKIDDHDVGSIAESVVEALLEDIVEQGDGAKTKS